MLRARAAYRPDRRTQCQGSRRSPCQKYPRRWSGSRKVFGLLEAQQARGQTSRRLSCGEAVRKLRQRFLVGFESAQISSVQLILFAELNPVVVRSLVGLGNVIGRLRADVNFGLRSPIVFAFGLAQKGRAFRVLNFNRVLCLRVCIWKLVQSRCARASDQLSRETVSACPSGWTLTPAG